MSYGISNKAGYFFNGTCKITNFACFKFFQEATALLSDEERRVLTLKYTEDRSYKEIADELGATVSAVQSKLHRARARLREKLAALAPNAVAPPT